MKIFEFRKYRTTNFMAYAMTQVLGGKPIRGGRRVVTVCPRSDCKAHGAKNLIWNAGWPIAYCFKCHRTIDALDAVRLEKDVDYYTAAQELDNCGWTG